MLTINLIIVKSASFKLPIVTKSILQIHHNFFSICGEVLKYPVTNLCGHSFCRECCFGHTKCNVCNQKFPTINTLHPNKQEPSCSSSITASNTRPIGKNSTITSEIQTNNEIISKFSDTNNNDSFNTCGGFEQDILIRKLVDKWWASLVTASEYNKEAERNLDRNLLDEALKSCNQSLDIGEFSQTKICNFFCNNN